MMPPIHRALKWVVTTTRLPFAALLVSVLVLSPTAALATGSPQPGAVQAALTSGSYAAQDDELEPCAEQIAARDMLHVRSLASLNAAELLREYQTALDEEWNATREEEYWKASVDVASLAAGWPLGSGAQEYLLGKASNTFFEKLVKAGVKSVEKNLLADPSLGGIWETLSKPPEVLGSGTAHDLAMEGINKLLGDAGDPVGAFYDLVSLGKNVYEGMSRVEAIEGMLRRVQDQILAMDEQHHTDIELQDHAENAIALCMEGVSHGDNWRWQEVRGALNLEEAVSDVPRPAPGPTASEGYFAFVLEGIGVVMATERQIAETPHCTWTGGGPRPCPGAPPAKIVGRLAGPHDNPQQVYAELKTKMECGSGYWGAYAYVGEGTAWLQNNVGLDACSRIR